MSKRFVNPNEDETVTRYFDEVKKYKLLTPEQEIELALRVQSGDEDAIEELVTANLRFVVSVAKRYQGQGLDLPDLINEGNFGLITAAYRFDPNEGYKFISYAVHWIKQAILQSLNDNSRSIRLPSNVINRLSKMRKAFEKFEIENEREPVEGDVIKIKNDDGSVTEIIYETGMPSCSSLNQMINEEGDELIELIPDDGADNPEDLVSEENLIKQELYKVIEILDEREQEIIKLYHGLDTGTEPLTLKEIGDRFGLTKERVRQIKEKAIRKMRHNAGDLFDLIQEEGEF